MQTREIIANMIGILTVQAIKREPITYGDLFKALRLETNRPVGQVVGEYLDYVTDTNSLTNAEVCCDAP